MITCPAALWNLVFLYFFFHKGNTPKGGKVTGDAALQSAVRHKAFSSEMIWLLRQPIMYINTMD
jgi:hypothetical protein